MKDAQDAFWHFSKDGRVGGEIEAIGNQIRSESGAAVDLGIEAIHYSDNVHVTSVLLNERGRHLAGILRRTPGWRLQEYRDPTGQWDSERPR